MKMELNGGGVFARLKNRYIGDRGFYKALLLLVLPIVVQQGITHFVNLLDNVMVGALGTESISGVAIVNQLIFVFNLAIFGGMSGASIYSAQYAGLGDYDGVRYTFRFKLLMGVVVTAVAILIFSFFGDNLISMYLAEDASDAQALALTFSEAQSYMRIALWCLAPFMLSQALGSSLRETGETTSPMVASIISLVVNLSLNYCLIYGNLGFPELGVRGAAIATAVARYTETAFLVIYSVIKREKYPFIKGALASLKIPGSLVKKICVTGAPLLINELMWSLGTALVNQCYSVRGLQVVAATNITSTVWEVFAIIMFSMGSAISIMVGQKLGAGDVKGAIDTNRKLLFIDLVMHLLIGGLVMALAGVIPNIYNIEPEVRELTTRLLVVAGAVLPLHAMVHGSYFAIRSGGRTIVTMLLDSVFMWVIPLPLAYVLCNHTGLGIVAIYACIQLADAVKLGVALPILTSGAWARNIVVEPMSQSTKQA